MRRCAEVWKAACASEFPGEQVVAWTTGAVVGAFGRACSWRRPENWGGAEHWADELRQRTVCAAVLALREHARHSHVPVGAFVNQKVIDRLRTEYERDCRFSSQISLQGNLLWPLSDSVDDAYSAQAAADFELARSRSDVLVALNELPEPHRSLLMNLYSEGCTEAQLAQDCGITQPGLHARKKRALTKLRATLQLSPELQNSASI